MDFGTKVDILGELGVWYREDAFFSDFLYINDLGVPLAVLMRAGVVEKATPEGDEWINKAWEDFCGLLDIDPYGEYDNLTAMLEYSDEY